ncbi:MAG: peptidase, partial [Runella sp.]
LVFDPLGPPEAAAGMALRLLLHPERLNRLVVQSALDASLPSLEEVLQKLLQATWQSKTLRAGYDGEIARLVEKMILEKLLDLSRHKDVTPQARGAILLKIKDLEVFLKTRTSSDEKQRAHYLFAQKQIETANNRPEALVSTDPLTPPDGAPIDPGYEWLEPACGWEQR